MTEDGASGTDLERRLGWHSVFNPLRYLRLIQSSRWTQLILQTRGVSPSPSYLLSALKP